MSESIDFSRCSLIMTEFSTKQSRMLLTISASARLKMRRVRATFNRLVTVKEEMSSNYEPSITDEMRARYLVRREADVVQLESALSVGDFKKICAIAHQIKGNAATFSYDDLEALAVALEKNAEAESRSAVLENLEGVKAWVVKQRSR